MASYLSLHGNDAVPHQFPHTLAHTGVWKDGILDGLPSSVNPGTGYSSELNELDLSHFSDLTEQTDPDTVPISLSPASLQTLQAARIPELCAPDPDLGLTPEKQGSFANNCLRNGKGKSGRKVVRFDVASSSESELEKSPTSFHNEKLISIVNNFTSQSSPNESFTTIQGNESSEGNKQFKPLPEICESAGEPTYNKDLEQIIDTETVKSTINKGQKKRIKSQVSSEKCKKGDKSVKSISDNRISINTDIVDEYHFPFRDNTDNDANLQWTSALERPEYNSTLRLGNELKEASSRKLNVSQAVKETLEQSETLRTDISEKAACRVNTQGDVYQGLTALEVPIQEILSQVEQNQKSKVKNITIKHKKDGKSKDLPEPDLMEFFTPDLQKEQVDLSVTGIVFPKESLSLASHDKAFDMYKHNLAWEEFD